MALDPLFDLGDVFLWILEVFTNVVGLTASHEAGVRRFAGLLVDRPAPVLDPRGEMIWPTVCFGILEVEIFGMRGGVKSIVSNVKMSGLSWRYSNRSRLIQLTGACLSLLLQTHPYVEPSREIWYSPKPLAPCRVHRSWNQRQSQAPRMGLWLQCGCFHVRKDTPRSETWRRICLAVQACGLRKSLSTY